LHSFDELVKLSQVTTNAVVVFRQAAWKEFQSAVEPCSDVRSFRMGHKQLYLVHLKAAVNPSAGRVPQPSQD